LPPTFKARDSAMGIKLDLYTATYYVVDANGDVIATNFLTRREADYFINKLKKGA